MKKVLFPGSLILLGVLLFYPFSPGSALYNIQSGIKAIGKSEGAYRNELAQKRVELNNHEGLINQITLSFNNAAANAPICPKTGQQIEIKMNDDPRPELREKCDALRAEIQNIEKRLSE